MNRFLKGITYSYHRNIGWQDRTIRTILGIAALAGTIYFYKTNIIAVILLGILAITQVVTVTSAKCIICYLTGMCTISKSEKQVLESKGVAYQK